MIEQIFGTVAFITSLIGLMPQIVKSYRTKSTRDLSMLMLINYLICSVAWIVHGVCIDSSYVVGSNITGLLIVTISIIQKVIYDRRAEQV